MKNPPLNGAAGVLRTVYQRLRPGRQPVVLREDFAGTSAESVAWVILQHGRRAIAVDVDGPTLKSALASMTGVYA